MPMFQTLLGELNCHMGRDKIRELAKRKDDFAPGAEPDFTFLMEQHPQLIAAWTELHKQIPPAIRVSLNALIHQALSTTPPTQVTFAWAPAYDYEMTVWQAPDTKTTKGGITVLLKTRYPDDAHPVKS